jgi:hypothetical protein
MVTAKLSEDSTYIIGLIDGPMTTHKANKLAKRYVSLIEESGVKLILNDMRHSKHQIDAGQSFLYASKDVKNIGLPKDIRSAILVSGNDHSHDFVEVVAQSVGYSVRVFYSSANALKWLKTNTQITPHIPCP